MNANSTIAPVSEHVPGVDLHIWAVGTASMNPRDLLASIRAVTISTIMGWIPTVEIRGVG